MAFPVLSPGQSVYDVSEGENLTTKYLLQNLSLLSFKAATVTLSPTLTLSAIDIVSLVSPRVFAYSVLKRLTYITTQRISSETWAPSHTIIKPSILHHLLQRLSGRREIQSCIIVNIYGCAASTICRDAKLQLLLANMEHLPVVFDPRSRRPFQDDVGAKPHHVELYRPFNTFIELLQRLFGHDEEWCEIGKSWGYLNQYTKS
jgi:hypothetical protein